MKLKVKLKSISWEDEEGRRKVVSRLQNWGYSFNSDFSEKGVPMTFDTHCSSTNTHIATIYDTERNKLSLFWVQNLDHHLRSKAEWGCYFSFKLGSHENQHCALFWGAKLSLECFIADVDLWSLKDLASLEDRLRLSFVIEIWLKREWKTSRSWRYNAMKKIKHNLINLRGEDGVDKPSHPVFHNILVFVE